MEPTDNPAEIAGREVNLSREQMLAVAENWCHEIVFPTDSSFENLLTNDCIVEGLKPGGGALRGPAEVRAVFQDLARFFPTKSCQILDSIVEGSNIAFRWLLRIETVPNQPDTAQQDVEGITMLKTRNGRIVELCQNYGRWWV